MKQITLLFLLMLVLSCGQDKPAEAPQTAPAPAAEVATLPSVPVELLEKIWKDGTQLDYIFYHHPFTMSVNEKPSIQYAVRHISATPAPFKPECKPTGRVTYQVNGEIVLDGDFYFSTGCTYFVFEINRVKTYANLMSDEAVTYFNNQIKQATNMSNQMTQQPAGQ